MANSWADRDERFVPEGRWAAALAAAIGRRQLRAMRRAGLPQSLHEPLAFLVERQVLGGDYGPVDRVEELRRELAIREGTLGTFDASRTHLPSTERARRADEARAPVRSMFDTAHVSSVSALWGTFLFLCARTAGARTIVELGSAVGISGCYLASAPSCGRFITVEGTPERAALAKAHLTQVVGNCEVINDAFQTALDRVLPGLQGGIDLVFIDGDKTKGSYLSLFDRLSPRLSPGALVVFDDIHWSDVKQDWKALCARPGLSFVVNVGRFGLCVWDSSAARPQVFTLYSLGGVDVYQMRRDVAAYLKR